MALADVGTWHERGPRIGGRVSGLVVSSAGDHMLVSSPGGGLWLRDASGPGPETWRSPGRVNDGDHSTNRLEWDLDEGTPRRLWRVNRNSLQRSTDLGTSWVTVVNLGAQPGRLLPAHESRGVRDASPFAQLGFFDQGVLYLYGWGCEGLWYSWDGETFEQLLIDPDPASDDNCIGNVATDPESHFVYVTTLRRPVPLSAPQELLQSDGPWGFGVAPPGWRRFAVGACRVDADCPLAVATCVLGTCAHRPPGSPDAMPIIDTTPSLVNVPVASIVAASRASDPDGDHRVVVRNASSTETYVFHWCAMGDGSCPCDEVGGGGECLRRRGLWTQHPSSATDPRFARALTYVREGDADELLVGGQWLLHSLDLGRTWTSHVLPQVDGDRKEHIDHNTVYYDAGLGYLWTGTDGANQLGLAFNLTRWAWQPGYPPGCTSPTECPGGTPVPHTDLAVWQAYAASPVPRASRRSPRRVLVAALDNGLVCYDEATGDAPAVGRGGGDVFTVEFSASNPDIAYMLGNGKVARSDNVRRARSCADVHFDLVASRDGWDLADGEWSRAMLAVHPTDPNRVFVVSGEGVLSGRYRPGDSPSMSLSPPTSPSPGHAVTSVYAERAGWSGRTRLYAGTAAGGLHVSGDEGESWAPWGAIEPAPELVFTITRGGTVRAPIYYVATSSGLYRGDPSRGLAWKRAPISPGYVVSDVEVDPTEPCRVYAALGYAGNRQRHRGGILVSTDFGATFPDSLTASGSIALHQGPVTDVEVDSLEPQHVYAASFGHGFWVYDWNEHGALPACSSGAPE